MRFQISLILATFLTASACTATPYYSPPPLLERLAGKPPEERQGILRNACLNEAEKITGRKSMWTHGAHGGVPVYDTQINRMKSLCWDMTDAYLSTEDDDHVILAQKCKDQLLPGSHSKNPSIVTHIQNMHEICEELTGRKIDLSEEK